ncbi:MAG: acetyl-CoA carboxylase biotin carboxyl carrier protein subunit [Bacteroidota bacterium]
MSLEIAIGERKSNVQLISKNGNNIRMNIDDTEYDADILMTEEGVYSVIINNHSYSVELMKGDTQRNYSVSVRYNHYDVEIIDMHARYLKNRQEENPGAAQDKIISPMPGKVIRLPFRQGDSVKAGETVIVIEAMKMQSEYKVTADCIIEKIMVAEGDTVEANRTLIVLGKATEVEKNNE